ncbi:MAG TPA: molybdenum ABC transporter ATP-binding protein [Gammaproteobacteria bacterium]|nr:molybdenum ABC transporter ATP-binding protein [Gammaproteobacteria bacterium]
MNIEARLALDRGEFRLEATFSMPAEGVTALFGPSGCGKTTLLRAFAGLEACPGGYLAIAGERWQDERLSLPPHRRAIGYVFQEADLFPHLSVRGNLEYGWRRVERSRRRVDFDQVVALMGLASILNRFPDGLSGGERQRVAIARALLSSPRLLLMDEPLAALDAASKAEILPFLERLHGELKIPLLYVSHAADEVARLADHLLLMDRGRIVAAGAVADLLTRVDLPLARRQDAETLIEARVAGHDREFGLTHVDFPGGRFIVSGRDLPAGAPVRLRILARDVSLTLERQSGTSILNIFPATVEELATTGPAQVTVRLSAGGVPVLSRITRRSAALLGLEPGKALYIQVKSVALLA